MINTHFVPLLVWVIHNGTWGCGGTKMVALSCIHMKDYFLCNIMVTRFSQVVNVDYIRVYHRFSFLSMTCH